jgi:hypothetical protein
MNAGVSSDVRPPPSASRTSGIALVDLLQFAPRPPAAARDPRPEGCRAAFDRVGSMDFIWNNIAIGNSLEARSLDLLREHSIAAVLSLDGSLRGTRAEELGIRTLRAFELADGPGNSIYVFRTAVDALVELAGTGERVLVHCHAGRSRSPVVVAGFLIKTQAMDPEAAMSFVAARREINVSAGLKRLLYQLG